MARIDRLKEEIGWLKIVFGISVAVDVSLVGWLVQNYATANSVLVGCALVAASAITLWVARTHRTAYDRMKKVEDARTWFGSLSWRWQSS